ncbi:MAG: tRNA uridine-5-carboxymethylaminomethyl(34) synthesis GTPase MnmE [Alloprevotella sp.]
MTNDTICAICTPAGGALGMLRVSGPQAIAITDRLFTPMAGRTLSERKASTLAFGTIHTPEGEDIDEVVVSLFRAPHSYTGEDITEISCHGSAYVMQAILHALIEAGCRTAEPGEYTRRAFTAGKLDLAQAEAVADLIASNTAASHRIALGQLKGNVSNGLKTLREQLLHITTLLELELDFSDHEDLEFADRSELKALVNKAAAHTQALADTFRLGQALKEGIPVVLAGQTNAGKSTLLNALCGEERAIVSDVHGTTRDSIEVVTHIDGVAYRLIDTAGLRQTEDPVEQIGIARTMSHMSRADIVLWVVDAAHIPTDFGAMAHRIHEAMPEGATLFVVFNKTDLLSPSDAVASVADALAQTLPTVRHIAISAHSPGDVDRLRSALASLLPAPPSGMPIISNARHYEALTAAHADLIRVAEGLTAGLSGDLVSEDLRQCLHHLADIVGEVTSTDVLHSVFSQFCIGK